MRFYHRQYTATERLEAGTISSAISVAPYPTYPEPMLGRALSTTGGLPTLGRKCGLVGRVATWATATASGHTGSPV
jgi:hypothetical protein